jgi:hypothetical protein
MIKPVNTLSVKPEHRAVCPLRVLTGRKRQTLQSKYVSESAASSVALPLPSVACWFIFRAPIPRCGPGKLQLSSSVQRVDEKLTIKKSASRDFAMSIFIEQTNSPTTGERVIGLNKCDRLVLSEAPRPARTGKRSWPARFS